MPLKVGIIDGRKTSSFPDSTKVLVDIFRSTSTIPYFFLRGASRIYPTDSISDARRFHKEHADSVLAGERWGVRIRGFELNNSPTEVYHSDVNGKTIVFTSTNGTKVLRKIQDTGKVVIASFVNVSAVYRELQNEERVDIVVSNRPDGPADEDIFFAEYFRDMLMEKEPSFPDYAQKVRKSRGALRMKMMGYGKDLEYCLKKDACDMVPLFSEPYIILSGRNPG